MKTTEEQLTRLDSDAQDRVNEMRTLAQRLSRWRGLAGISLVLTLSLVQVRADTPLKIPHYPTLPPHTDLVIGGPYDTIASGTANWGTREPNWEYSYEFLTVGNQYRIRQSGTIRRIRVNLAEAAGLTEFCFRVWRRVGNTYDLVGSSENLAPVMRAGPNTLDLQRPIIVQDGDYYGYRIASTAGANFYAHQGRPTVATYAVPEAHAHYSDYAWEAQFSFRGVVLPIEMYLQAPHLVAIGDSIISGYPVHASYLEIYTRNLIGGDIVTFLADQWRVTAQNMGVGGQTTSEIATRFTRDVVNLKPRIALLEGGANDILRNVGTERFLANWKQMLDACQTHGIKPIVLLIPPGQVYTSTQSQKREAWNTALGAMAAHYPRAVVVNASAYIGASRAGGPAKNLWNIAVGYSADGLHFNASGHQRIAQAIMDQYTEP